MSLPAENWIEVESNVDEFYYANVDWSRETVAPDKAWYCYPEENVSMIILFWDKDEDDYPPFWEAYGRKRNHSYWWANDGRLFDDPRGPESFEEAKEFARRALTRLLGA